MYRFLISFSLVLSVLIAGFPAQAAVRISYEKVSAENVNRVLAPLMDGVKGAVVIGFTNGHEHRVFAFGSCTEGKELRPDGDTLFEIGSLTKVFTSLLMADFYRQGKLSFDDPVKKFLPEDLPVPELNARPITLFQLATHSSGLPRNADNLEQFVPYGVEPFHQFLRRCKLQSVPGRRYSYSNAGYTLLGEALENLGAKPYEQLLTERILNPLQMENTHIVLKEKDNAKLAQSFGKDGMPVNSSPRSGGSAGGLKSSANDLLKLLDAAIQKSNSQVHRDIIETTRRRFRFSQHEYACLGWFYNDILDTYAKLGQIHGYSSAIEFSRSKRIAIVVLSSGLQVEAPAVLHKCSQLICGEKFRMQLN